MVADIAAMLVLSLFGGFFLLCVVGLWHAYSALYDAAANRISKWRLSR